MRRALGATSSHIGIQFLAESLLIHDWRHPLDVASEPHTAKKGQVISAAR